MDVIVGWVCGLYEIRKEICIISVVLDVTDHNKGVMILMD